MRGWTIASLLVLSVGVALPPPAAATICSDPDRGAFRPVPEDGAVDVPRNARIWVAGGIRWRFSPRADEGPGLSLVDASGQPVETKVGRLRSLGGGRTWILTPVVPLLSRQTYEVRHEEEPLSRFTTSSRFSEERPATPELEVLQTWGAFPPVPIERLHWMGIFSAGARVRVPTDGHLVLYDWDDSARIDPVTFEGRVRDAARVPERVQDNGPCSPTWPDAGAFSFTRMRAVRVDVTGAMSEWSKPTLVVLWPKLSLWNVVLWIPVLMLAALVVAIHRVWLFRSRLRGRR